ncbi:carboxypeptidase-like regulatory domain-containing protein [Algoriphagus sp. CAU 1675]|uniref:carboxypeptidase-like regulatory domain-containing protein n=1 Tax=Algoriphagus sp. CAU 1675 TaxID=3032597 RepID=UPI0023DB8CFB|nr:carboxypeptidase-like regulatory domain-containing protein [Algoriphagus sp. CAU 1675]MDF2157258.1 carboxypeptidase-like regulatory domain-containing protein [Algoriphagus sp. CAU 1675]
MRHFFLILLFFSVEATLAQTVTGVVREKGTGLPLPFANVFVNNTTYGAASDENGEFKLTGDFPSEIEVVASFVGYVTGVQVVSFQGKNEVRVEFELAFNESSLSEVELKSKRDKSWERDFRRFEEVFLALPDDPYRSQIEIHNPWVVDFEKVKVEKGPNYLKASAQEPLKISNRALGYEIVFYLQDFRMLRNASRFYGQVFYREMDPIDSLTGARWESGREGVYRSSVRNLNMSTLLNTMDSLELAVYYVLPDKEDRKRTNDFTVEINKSLKPVAVDSILKRPLGNGNYRIFLPGRMEVHHLDKPWRNDYYINVSHAISWIQAPEGYYDVDRKGIPVNPTQLLLSGYLGRQRLARILPLDFVPDKKFEISETVAEVVSSPAARLNRLREKVWLTSNKEYFYPGETVWLGGKMLYQEPSLGDTLSRVVYVDLVDKDSEIIQSATFSVEQGKINGGLELSQDLLPGDYVLRAYTHWNRNFSEGDQFVLPFPVLKPGFRPEVETKEQESYFGEILVDPEFSITDSLTYRVMDLNLEFRDQFDNPIDGDFVLSLTDVDAVVDMDQGIRLEQAMNWLDRGLAETFRSELTFPIEYGISLSGKFIPDNKRRPPVNPITIVRGDLEDYGRVLTDSTGIFWASGLYYADTAQIAIAALDEKMNPYGSVELFFRDSPVLPNDLPKYSYKIEPIPVEDHSLDLSGDFILLEEFVKEEEKTRETMADRNYGYGEPTQEIGPEDLEKLTFIDIWGKLRFRGGQFGNYNFGEKTGMPLLIINGQSLPYLTEREFEEILIQYEPSQLESIKVYSDNIDKSIFGMAGYAGVIMIETKKGFRTGPESDRKFNSSGFQLFPVSGFTEFPEFPKNPPADRYLRKKPTLYWEPNAKTTEGLYKSTIKIPYGVRAIRLKVEGVSVDGEVFYQVMEMEL